MADDLKGEKLSPADGKKVGYNFAFSSDLGSGKLIQITGVFAVDTGVAEMNAEFDKLRRALDRQVAKSALPAIEHDLAAQDRTIAGLKQDLEKHRAKGSKATAEQAVLDNMETTLRNLQAKRDDTQKLLERTRKEAE